MNYDETLAYLYASQPAFHQVGAAAYKPGFANTNALMEHLGNPHRQFRSVHVAGTNGKGSVSHLIAASLQCAGLKVGLYTSPHLVDFRERIRIGGQMIPRERVVDFVEENRDFIEQIRPSFFETTMAMAFRYFADEQVDIAVIEVGLGGRLDSTNVITPLLSVITNIGFDHTEFLGSTLTAIASEKAGIIKPCVPCVIGETDPETAPVFAARFHKLNPSPICHSPGSPVTLYFADQCSYLARCRERDIPHCQLHGIYQRKNMQTAYVALRALLAHHPELFGSVSFRSAVSRGFAEVCDLTGLRGRWEQLALSPLVICDTGHNSHGIRYVTEQLTALRDSLSANGKKVVLRLVFGMVSDKDVDVVMRLLPHDAEYYFTQARTHRAIPASELCAMAPWLHVRSFDGVADAVAAARLDASADDIIFIGGSNYVVGEAIPLF